ncbi:hypothetical protein HMPREF1548_02049 [Clostridium sp. KLE 1755]|nr:hypothetical protein HMPREF1548_02049 [Clostridium sp. KLE 1755]
MLPFYGSRSKCANLPDSILILTVHFVLSYAKIHENRLRRWIFAVLPYIFYGSRSWCANLPDSILILHFFPFLFKRNWKSTRRLKLW